MNHANGWNNVIRGLLAGCGAVLIVLASVPVAQAADLGGYRDGRDDRYARSPYDDPRYDYLYGRGAPPRDWYGRRPGAERYEPAPPPRYSRAPDRREAPGGRRREWAENDRGCVPRHVADARLRAQGWLGFDRLRADGPDVLADARHEDGGRYRLVIDRCSGRVVDARPLDAGPRFEGRRFGPYARWRGRE